MALVSLRQAVNDLNVNTKEMRFENSKFNYKGTETPKKVLIAPTSDTWDVNGEEKQYVVFFTFTQSLAEEMPETSNQNACKQWLKKMIDKLKADNNPTTQDGQQGCYSTVFMQETVDCSDIF